MVASIIIVPTLRNIHAERVQIEVLVSTTDLEIRDSYVVAPLYYLTTAYLSVNLILTFNGD